PIEYRYSADFKDIFEVRGYHRNQRGGLQPPYWENSTFNISYTGLDDITRKLQVQVDAGGLAEIEQNAKGWSALVEISKQRLEFYIVYKFQTGSAEEKSPQKFKSNFQ